MSRLENLLLLAWWGFLLLLSLFNWALVTRTESVGFLFMTFDVAWGLWLIVLGAGLPGAIRMLSWFEGRTLRRRTQGEITRLKARAFDERSGELESFANAVQERVERTLRGALGGTAPSKDAPKP